MKRKKLWWIPAACLAAAMYSLPAPRLAAYVEAPLSLGSIISQASHIVFLEVESVDTNQNLVRFRKIRDLKGRHASETIEQYIGYAGFHPREWQNVMRWAKVGEKAVFFHNGGASETAIKNYWYQCYGGGEYWRMTHAEPYLLRSFAGDAAQLAQIVETVLTGKESVAPCMVDGSKEDLVFRRARIQRLRVSQSLLDYAPQRDFVGWGAENVELVDGMPGFARRAALEGPVTDIQGIASADYDRDGKLDVCVLYETAVQLFRNGGGTFKEVKLPVRGGARGAAWKDADGDGFLDLVLASPGGPRLISATGNPGILHDVSSLLPQSDAWNLTDAAWIDANGDGRTDLLLANGFFGVRLFLHNGGDRWIARAGRQGEKAFHDAGGLRGLARASGPDALHRQMQEWLLVADVNRDGRDDVLVCSARGRLYLNTPSGMKVADRCGIPFKGVAQKGSFGDMDGDGDPDLFLPQGQFGVLLENDGSGRFHDVTLAHFGMVKSAGRRLTGATWHDLDADDRLDLILSAVRGPNAVFYNREGGRLIDGSARLGLDRYVMQTRAISVADFNGDGLADFALANEGSQSSVLFGDASAAAPVSNVLQSTPLPPQPAPREIAADGDLMLEVRASWPTYQGNVARTSSLPGASGPSRGEILWTLPGQRQHLSAVAAVGEDLLMTALGAFRSPVILGIDGETGSTERVVWSRGRPALRLPTASSPCVAKGMVFVGEGMHQSEAGAVSAFTASDGLPLWRLDLPGSLRHVEGAPCYADGRLYFGAGSGGIVCVDPNRVTFEARELTPAQVMLEVRKEWAARKANYLRERKTDDFAVPPDASALPSGRPRVVWTRGADRWHVDAAVAVTEGRVLAGSARLDDEGAGERALLCLDSRSGSLLWRVPLSTNPWGAPSVAEAKPQDGGRTTVLVGCSSIRFEPDKVNAARGEVVAVELATGRIKWRLPVPGGVLSPVSLTADGRSGIFAATDGVLRAVDTTMGDLTWQTTLEAPAFAGVAVTSTRVFAVDLEANVYACQLTNGKDLWKVSLGSYPESGLPGVVYGSPLCVENRLLVATHTLTGEHAGGPTALFCLGTRAATDPAGDGTIKVDLRERRVLVAVRVARRKLPHLEGIYPIEVVASRPDGKKAHETLLVADAAPSALQAAFSRLALTPGAPGLGDVRGEGPELRLVLRLDLGLRGTKEVPVGEALIDRKTGLPLGERVRWFFTGSSQDQKSGDGEEEAFDADFSGTYITVYPVSRETVIQTDLTLRDEALLELEAAPWLPPPGSEATLIISPVEVRGAGETTR